MKYILTFILILFLIDLFSDDITSKADSLFQIRDYGHGLRVLKNSIKNEDLSNNDKAEILNKIAFFYKDKVGDFKVSKIYFKKIQSLNLPENDKYFQIALKEISLIEELEKKFAEFERKLMNLTINITRIKDSQKIDEYKTFLLETLHQYPDYYRKADIYYNLAHLYFNQEKFGKAYKNFQKTLNLKPAFYLFKPIKSYRNLAYNNWIKKQLIDYSHFILIFFLLITIFLFYRSRPWKWFKFSHLFSGVIIIAVWSVLYFLIFYFLSKNFLSSANLIHELNLSLPAYIKSGFESPGSEIVQILFRFSVIGILWIFILSVGLKTIKIKWKAILTIFISGFLIFSALTVVFYFNYCDTATKTLEQEKNLFRKNIYFIQYDPEPYLLIDPKAYPDIDLNEIIDENMRKALEKFFAE